MLKIAFFGTPDFAVPSLRALVERGYEIVGVFTQPDRLAGRGNKTVMPAVKRCALEYGLPVFQFEKIKSAEGVSALRKASPDLMVTAAFGQLLSSELLSAAKYGCINVHASLLPKYRGAAPIQWAVINGEKVTGITTMYTDIGLDTGDILLKDTLDILPDETAGELFERLALLGAQTLLRTLEQLENGTLVRTPQNEAEASYFPLIKKEMAQIDFGKTAEEICCFVRGMNPWPVAFAEAAGGKWKVYRAESSSLPRGNAKDGEIICADAKRGLHVACSGGAVRLCCVQAPGSRVMQDTEYLRGHAVACGEIMESAK